MDLWDDWPIGKKRVEEGFALVLFDAEVVAGADAWGCQFGLFVGADERHVG